jgi:hypothetical protein
MCVLTVKGAVCIDHRVCRHTSNLLQPIHVLAEDSQQEALLMQQAQEVVGGCGRVLVVPRPQLLQAYEKWADKMA